MDGGARDKGSPPPKPSKFAVYQNPALSAALTTNSLRPSASTFLCILSIFAASAFALLSVIARHLRKMSLSHSISQSLVPIVHLNSAAAKSNTTTSGTGSQLPSAQTPPGFDQLVSTPWSSKRASSAKGITTEEELEQFLADVANSSGTTRSTPLRPVRMSPGSQKFSTPPKKREGDLPPPMSVEESIRAFENVGIYPQIEQWRDRLRQWFSSVLLNPLLNKIDTSHMQVMQEAAKLGISVTVSKVGNDLPNYRNHGYCFSRPYINAVVLTAKFSLGNMKQSSQQNSMIPIMQDCLDAITEHQRLQALMKGEWSKGLLPQSSVREDYTVQRIREFAEGTCLKNYEYLGSGEVYDKVNKKWTLELPTDSHLLLYLFCAFLEHPKWMLHVDSSSYAGSQSSKNPLFLGVLPPKDRFPEKYVAVISGVPSVLHPGACILAVGRQSPPIFTLYWDKRAQFSLQGRTALWDSILLLCHRIKVAYGGIVRGMHLGSSALGILPVLDPEIQG
ncbi:hypothetical protein Acr_26g0011950 [Actinidia rufa]|uniref:Transmembrane protein n=1 Tax=Actinidia rufa TaxID=165716 RepID=A0A7J0H495_9ERIC|nr:hypothetical protein Acr_26g0011950 [Actinidia rufa]